MSTVSAGLVVFLLPRLLKEGCVHCQPVDVASLYSPAELGQGAGAGRQGRPERRPGRAACRCQPRHGIPAFPDARAVDRSHGCLGERQALSGGVRRSGRGQPAGGREREPQNDNGAPRGFRHGESRARSRVAVRGAQFAAAGQRPVLEAVQFEFRGICQDRSGATQYRHGGGLRAHARRGLPVARVGTFACT